MTYFAVNQMFISHFSLIYEFPKCDEEPFWAEINSAIKDIGNIYEVRQYLPNTKPISIKK